MKVFEGLKGEEDFMAGDKFRAVVAIDSFKGSIGSVVAGKAAEEGIRKAVPDAEIIVLPLADGGEGTVETMIAGCGGKRKEIEVCGPVHKKVRAVYGILPKEKTAVIEMAAAAGLPLVPEGERNPWNTTSFGVGELITDALEEGCRHFIVGIGGSATNDGGAGMLQALGVKFYDSSGALLTKAITGGDLCKIERISIAQMDQRLKDCQFQIACDVNNPLCGPMGASTIFGPQKGADQPMIDRLEEGLCQFARVTKSVGLSQDPDYPGCGAAGGMGYGFLTYLKAMLRPGAELVLDAIKIDEFLKDADLLVTGEGRIDHQTAMGKAPASAAKRGKKAGVVVLAVAGCVTDDAQDCDTIFDGVFSIADRAMSMEEAMREETARKNMTKTVYQAVRLILRKRG